MDCSTPGFPIFHYILKFSQIHVHWVDDMSQVCHPLLLPFSCPQSFPASGSFPVSWLFASGGQSTGASVSASVLSMNFQGLFPLGLSGLISLLSKGLKRVFFQHCSLKASILQCSAFFIAQLTHLYMVTGKTMTLTIQPFVSKVISLLLNMLSRFVITFLPRSKRLWIMALFCKVRVCLCTFTHILLYLTVVS